MVTIIFFSLSPIWWLYDLVLWSVPLWISFMIKSISMLVLRQIKVTHYAQNSMNSKNTPNICSKHSIHPNIWTKTISVFHESQCKKKNGKKNLGQICLNSAWPTQNPLKYIFCFPRHFGALLSKVCQGESSYSVRGHLRTAEKGTKDQM